MDLNRAIEIGRQLRAGESPLLASEIDAKKEIGRGWSNALYEVSFFLHSCFFLVFITKNVMWIQFVDSKTLAVLYNLRLRYNRWVAWLHLLTCYPNEPRPLNIT